MVDFDLFRTQLTEAGFDLQKVEEIYDQAARAKQVLDAHLSAATGSFRPY